LTIFVDASALVSIAAREADALDLIDSLEADRMRFCSAVSLWETAAALSFSHMFSLESARARLIALREIFGLEMVGIGEREYDMALQAHAQFGKGRHPAGLNLGDCFAYACAKSLNATLLCKGNDFVKTDIKIAGSSAR